MPNNNPTPVQIEEFVHQVVDWTQVLEDCADGALARAHEDFDARKIDFATYAAALRMKGEVTQHCHSITVAASGVLLEIAEAELGPVEAATRRLAAASKHLDRIQDGVLLVSELTVAAVALVAAFAAPSPGTIAAASGALFTASAHIEKDVTW